MGTVDRPVGGVTAARQPGAVPVLLAGAGMTLLTVRPWAAAAVPWPTGWTAAAFAVLALAGWAGSAFGLGPAPAVFAGSSALPSGGSLAGPGGGGRPGLAPLPPWRASVAPLLVGSMAFLAAAVLTMTTTTGGVAAARWSSGVVLLTVGAAVAEELFFRGFLYDLVLPAGAGAAVVVSAACFALVHVTTWGWAVLPLDLAAGLVLSWQRAATGRWAVPAVTHVLANLISLR